MPPSPASRSRATGARASKSRATSRTAAPPAADGYKAIRAAIDEGAYAPVYYLHGDEDFLKDASLQALLDAAIEPTVRDFNCEWRSGGDLDAETLGSLLGTPPMLAERRAIVVRDVHALKKEARAELDRYLVRPAHDSLVVLLTPAGQAVDAKLAAASVSCVFERLPPERVRRWIVHHATTTLKVDVSAEAATLLEQSVGNDLQALAAELDKCASYAHGQSTSIDEAAVSAVVGVRRGETTVDLLDAIGMRETARALTLMPFVLSQPKMNAVVIIMQLATQMIALQWGRAQRDNGVSRGQLPRAYFEYLKATSGMVGRPWGEATAAWSRAVELWDTPALRRAVHLLLDTDVALKDTRVSNEEQIMVSLILALGNSSRGRTT